MNSSETSGMGGELPSAATDQEVPALERGHLPLWKAAVLGLAAMQVGPNLAITTGAVMVFAGKAAWVSNGIALVVILTVVMAVAACARRFVVTGSLMSYVHRTLGSRATLVVAASLILGYLAMAACVASSVVVFTNSVLVDFSAGDAGILSESLSCALVSALATVCAYRGIDASVRVTVAFAFLSIPLLLLVTIVDFVGPVGWLAPQLDLSSVPIEGIAQGGVVALGCYVGFDGLTAIAAETAAPLRNVPRVLLLAVGSTGIGLVLITFLQEPVLITRMSQVLRGESPIAILAAAGRAWMLRIPLDVLMALAVFASVVAIYNFGARVIATAAIEGLLPRYLAQIHPRFHSPHRSVVLIGLAGGMIPVVLQIAAHRPPLISAVYLSNLGVYFWLLPYAMTCIGAIRVRRYQPVPGLTLWCSILGTGALAGFAVLAFTAAADAPTKVLPYIVLGSTTLFSAILWWRAPAAYWQRDRIA